MNKALPLLALLLAGCGSTGTGGEKSAANYPSGLPDALKNDAFDYYGLGNDKPLQLEIVDERGTPTRTGTRQVRLDKIENGKASYVLTQKGGLSSEGDITLSLEPDGLYTMSSTTSKLKAHSLEMPAKMDIGGGWKDHTEMSGAQEIVLDNDLKIVGKERVATPGGTFDEALHVTSSGEGKMQGQPVILKTESWYVRGMGAVKQILNIEYKDKKTPPVKITMQLAAPTKPEAPVESTPAPSAMPTPSAAPSMTPPTAPPGAKK